MKNCKKNISQLTKLSIVLSVVFISTILFFSCSKGCIGPIYFTLINKSSEKIKFITRGGQNEEYTLKSGKSVNFDSYYAESGFKRLPPRVSGIEIIILSNGKTIKDFCDFTKGNATCDADRGFFDRKSYFYRVNKFNDCGWYQYVFTDEDVKRAK